MLRLHRSIETREGAGFDRASSLSCARKTTAGCRPDMGRQDAGSWSISALVRNPSFTPKLSR